MALRKPENNMSEYEMFEAFHRTGDKELRSRIIESYTYIAEILSRRFINRGVEYDDIYQVACMGIIKAVDRFDEERGVKFATFATPTVLGEIRKYFRDKGCFIKIPRRLYEIFYQAEQIKRSDTYGKVGDYSVSEVARILGLPEKLVTEATTLGDGSFIKSLEQEAFADGGMSVSNVLGIEDEKFLMIENKDFFNYVNKELTEDEKKFIELRYARALSQKDVGKALNISQMQVSRTEKRILKKLRDLYFRD